MGTNYISFCDGLFLHSFISEIIIEDKYKFNFYF